MIGAKVACNQDLRVVHIYFFFFKELTFGPIFWISSMSVCVFVCVFVCPSHFLTPLNALFAPTSPSPMSKPFRFSESLGKSNGKKRSKIGQLFIVKGVNYCGKQVSFSANFALLAGFVFIGATIRIGREILCLPYAGFLFFIPSFFFPFNSPDSKVHHTRKDDVCGVG